MAIQLLSIASQVQSGYMSQQSVASQGVLGKLFWGKFDLLQLVLYSSAQFTLLCVSLHMYVCPSSMHLLVLLGYHALAQQAAFTAAAAEPASCC